MACHFSPYGTGLCNCPGTLPQDAMVILNDRTPIHGHDTQRITQQLTQIVEDSGCSSVLLDFQRPEDPQTASLAAKLVADLPCPVGVSDLYARELDCPVFLPPVPLGQAPEGYLSSWNGREIWLDAALDTAVITVTEEGSTTASLPWSEPPENTFTDDALFCCYHTRIQPERIDFHLYRTKPQLEALLARAKALGVTRSIGLFQQLG